MGRSEGQLQRALARFLGGAAISPPHVGAWRKPGERLNNPLRFPPRDADLHINRTPLAVADIQLGVDQAIVGGRGIDCLARSGYANVRVMERRTSTFHDNVTTASATRASGEPSPVPKINVLAQSPSARHSVPG